MIRHNMFLALVGLLSIDGQAFGQEPVDAAQKIEERRPKKRAWSSIIMCLALKSSLKAEIVTPFTHGTGVALVVDFVDWHPSWWLASRYESLKPELQAQLNYWSPDITKHGLTAVLRLKILKSKRERPTFVVW